MRDECNGKAGKRSFTGLVTAEPKLVLYKDNANERNESLLLVARVQLVLYKDNANECNGKTGKRSFTGLDTAEPKLVLYKDK